MDTVLFPEIFPKGTNQVNISHWLILEMINLPHTYWGIFIFMAILFVSSSKQVNIVILIFFKEPETQNGDLTCSRLFSEWVEGMSIGQ